ncbi:RraA family protein [Lipingzhangella sp. LS1_29]|uniref:Putative 4-hydroxy-4-methyl-2-oxoglutarate aldolase n=1 Tax=Lipingzhangella rawalii TaxID=2055835 RepID=A0ABU2H254_9ACTN|nr:RraA family protein [Lipingzhangella rawalii]
MGTTALARNGARILGGQLFPVWPEAALAAPVFPVRCAPGDNLAVHVAVAQAAAGTALVIDVDADPDCGYVDEILAVAARMRELAGIIVTGCVRDVAAIARCGLPVISAGVSAREPAREGGGTVGRDIRIDGVAIRRGDWVIGDDDGVAVLPRGKVSDTVAATVASVEQDRAVLAELSLGRSTLEVLNLDPTRVTGWADRPAAAEAVPLRGSSSAHGG